ncbi:MULTISPECIES: molybdopterin-dependent oxidoreductase [unclassified Pseudodesulfovibrio]|uniref:molybdopterin-dependent oxidoreductase n=1 Tax=unclassified Pseudodesulfovibrio TaxID=2661612 RepID=UPI000FEB84C5|nr:MULTISPECIES: molybdopterin-dependent oxidoreductase [unclassified Pseudodesulfovibrio]MCJ2165570.1 molybdopterin-dependent oxidoreductase [Pseudodesulfovibrio sp. S3-i]RWU03070.1 nitrate reductase [Pseudodesulfovibrio sp. S3]
MTTITACTMDCGDACSLVVDAERRSVKGNPKHPFTKGFCCKKGSRYFERLDAEDRIVEPLVKRGSGFEPVSWDEAMGLVASRLDAARAVPESILHIHGHGYRGILGKASSIFFEKLGAATTYGAVCDDTGITACVRDFGVLNHNAPEDILNADRVVNWGRDMTRCSIHQLALIQKARKQGAEVLTISPGGDGTPEFSDVNVQIRPGTDRFLAAAVLKLYLESGALNPWVLNRTANWPILRGLVDGLNFKELCAACEVRVTDAEMVYDWYADTGNVATVLGWGLQRHLFGGENVRFINALAMISGNVGVKGGGAYFNISSNRNLGTWAHLVKGGVKPGQRRELLIQNIGMEIRKADPAVEFVWIDGHNVVNQVPDCLAVVDALAAPFVVVVEGFMTDTAMQADVILPPAFMFERRDVLGSFVHNCVNHCAPAVEPRGQARSDFDILSELGSRLEKPLVLPDAETCIREGLKPANISYGELMENGFVRVHYPQVAFEKMEFGHPDGLYRFPEELHPEPERDPDYPLQLLTLVRGESLHSQIAELDQRGIPTVWVSKKNPAWAALNPAMDAYLVTEQGAMQVRVETLEDLHPRAVIIRRGGWMKYGHSANVIIKPMVTDMGDGTAYYSQTCRLENR